VSASHALPASTAAAAVGIVPAARRAASRYQHNRHGAGAARSPWRRTTVSPGFNAPPARTLGLLHSSSASRAWDGSVADLPQGAGT
jgi:hypothetical protein